MPDDDNPTLTPLLISRKDLFMERFKQSLQDDSIYLDAFTYNGTLPNGAFSVCTRFHTIDQILANMMKEVIISMPNPCSIRLLQVRATVQLHLIAQEQ